jgi:hypothetical protein
LAHFFAWLTFLHLPKQTTTNKPPTSKQPPSVQFCRLQTLFITFFRVSGMWYVTIMCHFQITLLTSTSHVLIDALCVFCFVHHKLCCVALPF